MNSLNLERSLRIDDIFRHRRCFLLFSECFGAFISLFLLLIQSGCSKLFCAIGLDRRRGSCICACLCIWDTWVNDSSTRWRSLEHFCGHRWRVCKFDTSCQKKRVSSRFLNEVARVSVSTITWIIFYFIVLYPVTIFNSFQMIGPCIMNRFLLSPILVSAKKWLQIIQKPLP